MAELLLYKGPHWMDNLTPQEVEGLGRRRKVHYEHRNTIGDFIEIQDDGKWPDKAAEAGKFYYVRIKGQKKERFAHLTEPVIRDFNFDEQVSIGSEVDNEIAEIQKNKAVNVIAARMELMEQKLSEKPVAFKRRYYFDIGNLAQEEAKTLEDGKFLELSLARFNELIKDKTA